jgi:hypothetical protein
MMLPWPTTMSSPKPFGHDWWMRHPETVQLDAPFDPSGIIRDEWESLWIDLGGEG